MKTIILFFMAFLFGINIGSFLNVCIYRIPKKEDIVKTRSHCMGCGSVLKWYELIPLFSFVIQRGRCRNCKAKLSLQYPLIELTNGLIYIWIVAVMGVALESVLCCICASVLIVVSIIDLRIYEIPFGCNILIGILGMIRLLLDMPHWYRYIIGFFLVSSVFLLIYYATRGMGIGGGDIKLMAAAGLFLGWQQILLALMAGSVAGCVIHLTLMKLQKKDRVLAFGPYLAFGIFTAMLYGEKIINLYLSLIGI